MVQALVMVCQVCSGWSVGHWSLRPELQGVHRVLLLKNCGVLRPHELQPRHVPVWGRVNFCGQRDKWVLLCSPECHDRCIQDMSGPRYTCDADATCGMCQVCERWLADLQPFLPALCGLGRVFPLDLAEMDCTACLECFFLPSDFPAWGYVDFWGNFDARMLLCSWRCHHNFLQDPEEF